jgi:hypothetical protein
MLVEWSSIVCRVCVVVWPPMMSENRQAECSEMRNPLMTVGYAMARFGVAPGSLLVVAAVIGVAACARPEPAWSTPSGGSVEAVEASAQTEAEVAQVEASADAGWASILQTYVTSDGGFRYAALLGDVEARAQLQAYVAQVGALSLDDLAGPARLAALINAYNALTVESVLQLWPVESVLQEEGFFDARMHVVGGVSMTLNTLENEWIRTLGEPRIHFAVNCASVSCPALAAEPWQASTLEAMLEERTRVYVQATTVVNAEARQVQVSTLFNWFAADFGGEAGVREFVAARLDDAAAAQVRDGSFTLTYAEYDWALNGR